MRSSCILSPNVLNDKCLSCSFTVLTLLFICKTDFSVVLIKLHVKKRHTTKTFALVLKELF